MKTQPFSIRIFVATGDPQGLRTIERSNWNGKALIFPRPVFSEVKKRPEFDQPGIYLLIGPDEAVDADRLYIGEGDPVRPRIESHHINKEFWTRCILFASANFGALNKAHIQYLESRLIEIAHEARRAPLDNRNKPNPPSFGEADQAEMEVYLSNLLEILPLLGITAFEKPDVLERNNRIKLEIQGKGALATGHESTDGFVVHEGSTAVIEVVQSLDSGPLKLRNQLVESGVLNKDGDFYRFSQDFAFTSPSMAATVVLGRSSNGRTEWKDESGNTLKALQEREPSPES